MNRKFAIPAAMLLTSVSLMVFAERTAILGLLHPEKKQARTAEPPAASRRYDAATVAKLDAVLEIFARRQANYTIGGDVNLVDRADTADKMDHVPFIVSKSGNDFYYKMGQMETISEHGAYININPETHKVFVAEKRPVGTANLINAEQLEKILQTEEYDLRTKMNGRLETISLVNERHYTCKEYGITFDTLSKKLTRIDYRLAYPKEPMNRGKEKLIRITLSRCDTTGNTTAYTTRGQVLDKKGKLRDAYEGYELIHL